MAEQTDFLQGGGRVGALIRARDWGRSALGLPEQWPVPLRITVRLMLTTQHPVLIFWGPELICLYNDSFSASLGPEKHPSILGSPGREAWADAWPIVGTEIEGVLAGRGPVWHEDRLVPIVRHGELQDVYWTYSYSPIDDAAAPSRVGGVLVLCVETTGRHKAEETLRESNARLQDFLAILGHELRNPLAPLRTGLDLLTQRPDDPELHRQVVPMMGRQLAHLIRLVNDLLDISRVSRGKVVLRRELIDLHGPVRAAVEQVAPLLEQRQHELRLDLLDARLPVRGDFERITQVLANLISNAARYTDPGGTITIETSREGEKVVTSVRDTGRGIAAGDQHRLFKLFSQITEHQNRSVAGGLGVGLALSRQLVELHGGTIEVKSSGPGTGSEFRVCLPVSRSAEAVSTAPSAKPAVAVSRRVLIVDDNADAADSLRTLLELQGHSVDVAYAGEPALKLMDLLKPEVVLLDLGLPGMDGVEVARRARSTAHGRRMCIIAVTGWGQENDRHRTRTGGFDHHLTKPVEPRQLASLFAELDQPRA